MTVDGVLRRGPQWVDSSLSRPPLDFQPDNLLCWPERPESARTGHSTQSPLRQHWFEVQITAQQNMSCRNKGASMGFGALAVAVLRKLDGIYEVQTAAMCRKQALVAFSVA
jgi:hypothetical protein